MLCLTLFCQERNLTALVGLVIVPMIQTESSRSILRALTTLRPLVLDCPSARLAIVEELNSVTDLNALHYASPKETFHSTSPIIIYYRHLSTPNLTVFPGFPKKTRGLKTRVLLPIGDLSTERKGVRHCCHFTHLLHIHNLDYFSGATQLL